MVKALSASIVRLHRDVQRTAVLMRSQHILQ